jgi:hypothetical protein
MGRRRVRTDRLARAIADALEHVKNSNARRVVREDIERQRRWDHAPVRLFPRRLVSVVHVLTWRVEILGDYSPLITTWHAVNNGRYRRLPDGRYRIVPWSRRHKRRAKR